MKDRVLVTGGAGFIGSHVCEQLCREGRDVVVLDNLVTGFRENLAGLDVTLVEGSVAKYDDVEKAMAGCNKVVHLAALPSVARSLERPLDTHEACATGTANVLQAANLGGARVVYAGSSSAYGNQEAKQKHELLREDPLSPYSASKLSGELYCRTFARVFGMNVVVTRFFNVFGPRQPADSPYSGVMARAGTSPMSKIWSLGSCNASMPTAPAARRSTSRMAIREPFSTSMSCCASLPSNSFRI